MAIVFEQVSYCHDGADPATPALDDVSLAVADGAFACVVGRTGSGKSTLVEHINATRLPSRGTVTVGGINTADRKRRRELRRRVGYAMQYPEYQLFAETVLDDVSFGPRNLGWNASEAVEAARAALVTVGLDPQDVGDASPFDLSGGQRRRIALAGVIACEPQVLVADEPMAGLDPRGRAQILAILRELNARGTTVVMVSHSMEDVAALASQVVVLSTGRVVLDGTPAQVFSRGNVEVLRAAGVGLPAAAAEALRLEGRGMPPADPLPLTVDDLVARIAAALGTGLDSDAPASAQTDGRPHGDVHGWIAGSNQSPHTPSGDPALPHTVETPEFTGKAEGRP